MEDIRRVLNKAARRLWIIDLLRSLALASSAVLALLVVALFVDRLSGRFIPWATVIWSAAALTFVVAFIWSTVARARGVGVARELDERAGLRETLSTALCVASQDDAWSQAVVATARERARKVVVRDAIRVEAPRLWPVPLALALAFALLYWTLPDWDLTGKLQAREDEQQREQELVQAQEDLKIKEAKLEEILRKANVDMEKNDDGDATGDEASSADDLRRTAIRKLTNLTEQLNARKDGAEAEQSKAMRNMMRQLKQPGPGPLQELSRNLAKGDFAQARKDLDELAQKLSDGSLSDEQKAELKKQLENLKQQIDKLSQQKSDLERMLQEAGFDKDKAKQLAQNPEALKQALEQMENLTEEQKQQLQQMAKAQQQACQQCNGMSGAMGQMAQGLGKMGMSQEGMEGMQSLAGQLSNMEMLEAEMAGLDSALGECMSQLAELGQCMGNGGFGENAGLNGGIRPWSEGDSNRFGRGSGGPGKGYGPSTAAAETDYIIEKTKTNTHQTAGPIIGSRLVYGDQVRGESTAEFSAAVEQGKRDATEALENLLVPLEFQTSVKAYYSHLERVAEKSAESTEPESDDQ